MGKRRANQKQGTRRAYLKRFSQAYINTGSAMNPVVAAEYAARAQSIPDPYLERMFPGIIQNNLGRKEALRRKVAIMMEDVPKDNFVVVLQCQGRCVLLYYNSGKSKWFFVRKTDTEIAASITYPSRQIAERVWKDGEVVFDIREEIAPAG